MLTGSPPFTGAMCTMQAAPTRSMFRRLGGRVELLAITRAFYDKVYRHRWLSKFFAYVDQDHIARQQADFMAGVLAITQGEA